MITIPSANDMENLGARVARLLRAGDVVCLTGELGAGKTTFSRGLGRELAVRGTVTSPTFVVARTHPRADGVPFVHVDAYRLVNASELADLDIDWDRSISVVEWGRGMLEAVVDEWLEIAIDRSHSADDETRTATLHAVGPRGNELVAALGRGVSA
ncbi:MAG: tRNA (adenosine(37)-N6)-threonylcarbamoyltransferase complex ATPase subunit type 1 TsaE [Microbacteriaceae bacterium]|nr:tRNA (adenosine(37)-N6)-threonylcarbamoyltransferase complex ATPase subunit type 1 TsaE [Microbacteriaceae bacterium]